MTDIPQTAPRSEDGQYWWDGAQWQPVFGAGAGAEASAPASAAAPSTAASGTTPDAAQAAAAAPATGGQISDDGQWQWDGSTWQPVPTAAPAAPAAQPAAPALGSGAPLNMGDVTLTIDKPMVELIPSAEGITGLSVFYTVTNAGTAPIAAGALTPKVISVSARSAEAVASYDGRPFEAFGIDEKHEDIVSLQLDAGEWSVFIQVVNANGDSMGMSEGVLATVPGSVTAQRDFDDKQPYALSVTIQQVEHLSDHFFRVHYILQNNSERELPAGMRVEGELGGEASTQYYQMQSSLAAHQSHTHYLTLEAQYPVTLTATILVDKDGPSQISDTVNVDIAQDGTPTMSR
jgi:hypothetical protein